MYINIYDKRTKKVNALNPVILKIPIQTISHIWQDANFIIVPIQSLATAVISDAMTLSRISDAMTLSHGITLYPASLCIQSI